jgi:hypothetical protein
MSTDTSSPSESGLFQSIRPITRAGAVRDAMAGFQLAAMNIPQVPGYTRIAGTPIATGFYTLLLPLVGFAAFARFMTGIPDEAQSQYIEWLLDYFDDYKKGARYSII